MEESSITQKESSSCDENTDTETTTKFKRKISLTEDDYTSSDDEEKELPHSSKSESDLKENEDNADSSTDCDECHTSLKSKSNSWEGNDDPNSSTYNEETEPLINLKPKTNVTEYVEDHTNVDSERTTNLNPEIAMREEQNFTNNAKHGKDNLCPDLKLETEMMVDENDVNIVSDNDRYYETQSESGNSLDYEPEEKRTHSTIPKLPAKKSVNTVSAAYIYGKFVMRQCPMCEIEFSSAHCWKKHINFMHHLEKPEHLQFKYNERGAKCKLCNFQTPTPCFNKLLDHEISHMPNNLFLRCKLCDWKTKAHSSMNFHLREQHAEKFDETNRNLDLTVCPYCRQEFASQWYLHKHLKQEHEKKIDSRTTFICLDCGDEFSSNINLRTHVYQKFTKNTPQELGFEEMPGEGGKEKTLKCTNCSQVYKKISEKRTKVNIAVHYMLHSGESSDKLAYKCKYCGESFPRFGNMRFHNCELIRDVVQSELASLNAGSNQDRFRKRKMAKDNSSFEPVAFKREYMKTIRHVCLKCGMSFGKTFQCKKHMFTKHGMNKPPGLEFKKIGNQGATEIYECTVCEEFTCDFDLNTMLVHARTHTIFDPFQCKLCQMTFAYDTDIPGHMCVEDKSVRTDKNVKRPKENALANMENFCPKCGQSFSTSFSLTRHMHKTHGMNEPYGLGFEVLKVNDRTTFRCTECLDFTTSEKDLREMLEHARRHLPFKSFSCTLCSEQFQLKNEAKQHECSVSLNQTQDAIKVYREKNDKNLRLKKMGRFCPKCGKKFVKTSVCKTHITRVHGMDKPFALGFEKLQTTETANEIYRCKECVDFSMTQPDVNSMMDHARAHLPYNSFWCILCEKQFRLRIDAKKHRCDNDGEGEVESIARPKFPKSFDKCIKKLCPECNNEMPSIKTWRWHMGKYHNMNSIEGLQMKQTNANLVECLICQVHISYQRRQEHRFLHLPYKPFQCKFCGESFIEVDKAKTHCKECKHIPTDLPERDEEFILMRTKSKKHVAGNKTKMPKISKHCTDSSGEEEREDEINISNGTNQTIKEEQKSKIKKEKLGKVAKQKQKHDESVDDGTLNKGISVVLTDDNDYAKFVRISCPLCPDTEFEANRLLSVHFQEVHNSFQDNFTIHNTNAANCKTCNKYFNTVYKKTLARHYLGEINSTCYCCRLCDKSFLYFNTMRSHLLDEHEAIIAGQSQDNDASSSSIHIDGSDPLKLTGKDISKVSKTTMAIRTNKTAVFNEFNAYISYACPECNEHFGTSEQWHLHINGEHNFFDQNQLNIEATADGYKRCKQCKVHISGGVLGEQRHKLTHMKYKSFICTLCLHRSTTLGVLTQHFRRRHFAKGSFKCPLCTEVLTTSYEQIEHLKNDHHPNEYPRTICLICYNIFSSITSLNTHKELHNPDRVVFQCQFCERSYKYRRELTLHTQAKHPGQQNE